VKELRSFRPTQFNNSVGVWQMKVAQQSRLSRLQERPVSNKEGAERDERWRIGGWVMLKSQTPIE